MSNHPEPSHVPRWRQIMRQDLTPRFSKWSIVQMATALALWQSVNTWVAMGFMLVTCGVEAWWLYYRPEVREAARELAHENSSKSGDDDGP